MGTYEALIWFQNKPSMKRRKGYKLQIWILILNSTIYWTFDELFVYFIKIPTFSIVVVRKILSVLRSQIQLTLRTANFLFRTAMSNLSPLIHKYVAILFNKNRKGNYIRSNSYVEKLNKTVDKKCDVRLITAKIRFFIRQTYSISPRNSTKIRSE